MNALDKAEDLTKYTIDITDNQKYFPKKRRFTFVDRIQNLALDICDSLVQANETSKTETDIRRSYQRKALSDVKRLKFLVRFSCDKGFIDVRQLGIWSKKILDVQNMTAAWYKRSK